MATTWEARILGRQDHMEDRQGRMEFLAIRRGTHPRDIRRDTPRDILRDIRGTRTVVIHRIIHPLDTRMDLTVLQGDLRVRPMARPLRAPG